MQPRVALEYLDQRGQVKGFMVTPRDQWILRNTTRWYALSSLQLARLEPKTGIAEWHPDFGGDPDFFARKHDGHGRLVTINRRINQMVNVVDTGPGGVSQMITKAWLGPGLSTHSVTTFGSRVCGLNGWVYNNTMNPLTAPHAMAAADIGTQIERTIRANNHTGLHVVSERELRRNDTINHKQERAGHTSIPAVFESEYRGANAQRGVTKIPDLAVLSPGWDRYVAVEIERERDRPITTYVEKLQAYRRNTSIDAVWYVCQHDVTAARVRTAAVRVFGNNFARVRILKAHTDFGFWQIRFLHDAQATAPLQQDLSILMNRTTKRGISYEGTD